MKERGKSQYKMLASPLLALLAKIIIIVHILIIIQERDRQTKQKKDKKSDFTSQLVS